MSYVRVAGGVVIGAYVAAVNFHVLLTKHDSGARLMALLHGLKLCPFALHHHSPQEKSGMCSSELNFMSSDSKTFQPLTVYNFYGNDSLSSAFSPWYHIFLRI